MFIGPADLAASMGYLGRPHDPVVVEAVARAISDITACGTVAGVNAFDETLARRYIAAGARFVLVGADVTILSNGSDELARRYVVTDKNS